MTATNHTLAAANLVAAIPRWWVVPVAFISHFLLDALPHHGELNDEKNKRFYAIYSLDFFIVLTLIIFLFFAMQNVAILLGITIFAATAPDIVWVYRHIREQVNYNTQNIKMNRLTKFHISIQKHEYPWGIYLELVYFAALISLLLMQLK